MIISRRNLLCGTAALATAPFAIGLPAFAQAAQVDIKALNEPSAIGEMALGPETAKVTIIEYASTSCPHCAAFYTDVFVQLKKDYIDTGKVRFILREFPHNDLGMAGFMLARCAPKDKYFPIVDVLFATQPKWTANPLNELKNIALQAGFTEESFNACLKNQAVAKGIMEVRSKGEAFGVSGIPTIFINGEKLDGEKTYDVVKAKIDPLLG
jgi:protein-disulfide isomerase